MLKDNFVAVIQAVSKATDIPCDEILSETKRLEVVDARSIAMKILNDAGYCPGRIARLFHKTEASVRYTLANFDDRKNANKILENLLQTTRKILENK